MMLTQTPPMMLVSLQRTERGERAEQAFAVAQQLVRTGRRSRPRRSARGTGSASCRGSRRGPSSFRSTACWPGSARRPPRRVTFCTSPAPPWRRPLSTCPNTPASRASLSPASAAPAPPAWISATRRAMVAARILRAPRCRPARTARRWPSIAAHHFVELRLQLRHALHEAVGVAGQIRARPFRDAVTWSALLLSGAQVAVTSLDRARRRWRCRRSAR